MAELTKEKLHGSNWELTSPLAVLYDTMVALYEGLQRPLRRKRTMLDREMPQTKSMFKMANGVLWDASVLQEDMGARGHN